MLRTISISEPVYDLLNQEAKRTRLSPNDLAERLLAERLSAEQQAWRQQFDALLTRVHARLSAFEPAEIEADITAASEEAKAERRASRRSR
jgi:predicted CopG family antitoxin